MYENLIPVSHRVVHALLLLFDRLHTLSMKTFHSNGNTLNVFSPSPGDLTFTFSWLAKQRLSSNDLFISRRYNARKKSATSGSLHFYKWTLKGKR